MSSDTINVVGHGGQRRGVFTCGKTKEVFLITSTKISTICLTEFHAWMVTIVRHIFAILDNLLSRIVESWQLLKIIFSRFGTKLYKFSKSYFCDSGQFLSIIVKPPTLPGNFPRNLLPLPLSVINNAHESWKSHKIRHKIGWWYEYLYCSLKTKLPGKSKRTGESYGHVKKKRWFNCGRARTSLALYQHHSR